MGRQVNEVCPNQDSSRQAIVTVIRLFELVLVECKVSKSGLEPTGDCDLISFTIHFNQDFAPRPNQDSSRQAIVTARHGGLLAIQCKVQIRTRADRRL